MPDTFDLLRERARQGAARIKQDETTRTKILQPQAYAGLVADPRWQVYVNWLTTERTAADLKKAGYLQILETSFLASESYGILKVKLANALGRRDAIDDVLEHINNILEQEHADAP